MMKYLIILVLAILASLSDTAVIQNSRTNLNVGYVQPGDRLLQRSYIYQPARPNVIQFQDYVYNGNRTTRISAVLATEVGYTQYANVSIIRGGIGYNNVTVRMQSARGYGYYYAIDVWGR